VAGVLEVRTRWQDATPVFEVAGEADAGAAAQLRAALAAHLAHETDVVIDFQRVVFLDSSTLAVLIAAQRLLAAHHNSLRLVCTQGWILKLFRITGLDQLLPVYADVEEALHAADAVQR
jgi:anti-sigma B factor antagonist